MSRLSEWIRRNVIDDDPNPEYSRLDNMDGLIRDREASNALAHQLYGDRK